MSEMTLSQVVARLLEGPVVYGSCSICSSPLSVVRHEHMAAFMLDTRCDCGGWRELGPSDVVTWEDAVRVVNTPAGIALGKQL